MLFYGVLASAQLRDNNLNAIDITGGYAENGYGISLSYSLYVSQSSSNNYMQLSMLYTFANITKKEYEFPYNLITANIGYFYNIPIDKLDKYNFNVGGGLVGGVERINKGKMELSSGAIIDSEGGFVYGPFIGSDFETFISNNVSLVFKGNGYYHINSDIGNFTIYVGGGLRIFL